MSSEVLIMLVEDDEVDVMTIKRAFKDAKINNPLVVCANGVEALEYLIDRKTRRPGIILLDLNMPKMNGLELLAVLKYDDQLKTIPVVVLTTSKTDQDKIESYKYSVAGYMIKPLDYLQFVEIVKTIHLYWKTSELPNDENKKQ